MIKQSRIKQISKNKFRIYSRSGKNLGTYKSRKAAEERLKEIEMFKHMKKKKSLLSLYNLIKISKNDDEQLDKIIPKTFSSVMRDINKENPSEIKNFMESFKESFNRSLLESVENPDEIALMQTLNDVKNKYAFTKKQIKLAGTILEMGNADMAGKTIANMVKYLASRMPTSEQSKVLSILRNRISKLNEYEIAAKRNPPSSALGQAIAFIKNMLSAKNAGYIRDVLNKTVDNLY